MRIFKMHGLAKFVRRERISDARLREAIERAERGTIDADLGGGLIKQRVARQGQGRSGGYRMMIAYVTNGRAIFLLGFAKMRARTSASTNWPPCANWWGLASRAGPANRKGCARGVLLEVSDD